MRVVTANLQHGHPVAGGADSHGQLAAALAPLDGDVVALQEVDVGQARSGRIDQAAVAAGALGTRWWRFAAEFAGQERGVRRRAVPSHVPGRPGYGVALLSRWPVVSWHVRPLRPGPTRWPALRAAGWQQHLRYPRLDPPRTVLAAVVDGPAGRVTVACTHLSVDRPTARRQLAEAAWALRTLPGPHLLVGDLNLEADDVAAVTGMTPLARVDTFTAARPRRQLDHVLSSPGLCASGPPVTTRLAISDHLALAVDVVGQESHGGPRRR